MFNLMLLKCVVGYYTDIVYFVTYICLLLCRGRASRSKEVVPVEVLACNEPGLLLSDSTALLRRPPVFIQIQPAAQMDAVWISSMRKDR